jgi:hypothetical protein
MFGVEVISKYVRLAYKKVLSASSNILLAFTILLFYVMLLISTIIFVYTMGDTCLLIASSLLHNEWFSVYNIDLTTWKGTSYQFGVVGILGIAFTLLLLIIITIISKLMTGLNSIRSQKS